MIDAAHLTGQWDDYHAKGDQDEPIHAVVNMVRSVYLLHKWDLVFLTARPEKWRLQTMQWLLRHQLPCSQLIMRPPGDLSPSPELKVRLIRQHFPDLREIAVILEDRDDVVAALRDLRRPILQVHHP